MTAVTTAPVGNARPTRRPLAARFWLCLAVLALPVEVVILFAWAPHYRWLWSHDAWGRPVLAVQFLSVALGAAGSVWLILRRPTNRCGALGVVLTVTFSAWFVTAVTWGHSGGWRAFVPYTLVYSLRPLLYLLILAFPIGRLDRLGRRVFAIYTAGTALAWAVNAVTADVQSQWPNKPIVIIRSLPASVLLNSSWWDVGVLFMAIAVLVVVWRRTLRFGAEGSRAATPAFWAALVATGADFVLFGVGPIRDLFGHGLGLTPFGSLVVSIDYLRWGLVVPILAWGARRVWPRELPDARIVDLDVRDVDESLRDALARALDDPTVDVAVRDPHGAWLDLRGDPHPEPGVDGPATILVADGDPVAALEYDQATSAHPAVVDAALVALALQLESARQVSVARNREVELRRLGVQVLDAEDAARRRLERDLHDGAQQALVGLTLHAALTARRDGKSQGNDGSATVAACEVAAAVEDARRVLAETASGRPPALLAARGLSGALGALVLTAGIPVAVVIDDCDSLPERTQRTLWFIAAEAVTNALKHAHASALHLELRRRAEEVVLDVVDDGCGGVTDTPAALSSRVAEARGDLVVTSNSSGTRVHVRLPIMVEVPS
jgi:signal transduction histidine kinase